MSLKTCGAHDLKKFFFIHTVWYCKLNDVTDLPVNCYCIPGTCMSYRLQVVYVLLLSTIIMRSHNVYLVN